MLLHPGVFELQLVNDRAPIKAMIVADNIEQSCIEGALFRRVQVPRRDLLPGSVSYHHAPPSVCSYGCLPICCPSGCRRCASIVRLTSCATEHFFPEF